MQCKFYFHSPLESTTQNSRSNQVQECLNRIQKRRRLGEEKISLEYLQKIEDGHDNYKEYLIQNDKTIIKNIVI